MFVSTAWAMGGQVPGMPPLWLVMAVKLGIMFLAMGGMCLLLRWLYGPGGRLRPKEFGTGHIEARKDRKARLAELKRRYKAKDLTAPEFCAEREKIWNEARDLRDRKLGVDESGAGNKDQGGQAAGDTDDR